MSAAAFTMQVDFVRDLGEVIGENDCFAIWVVLNVRDQNKHITGTEKKRIRVMKIAHLNALREANHAPADMPDSEFLLGDSQFKAFMRGVDASHLEFSLCKMETSKKGGQKLDFPADAFFGGTVKSGQP